MSLRKHLEKTDRVHVLPGPEQLRETIYSSCAAYDPSTVLENIKKQADQYTAVEEETDKPPVPIKLI